MIFNTQISGIECRCRVIHYRPYVPAKLSGPMEDAEEAIPAEFEFTLLDTEGRTAAPGLYSLMNTEDEQRLQDEYEAFIMAEKHGKDF